MPATSQLEWLSSTTAMIVLFWSRATRDLLRSFDWGIAALHRENEATKLPCLVPLAGAWLDCRKLARRADPPGATVPFPVLEAPRRDMCPGGLSRSRGGGKIARRAASQRRQTASEWPLSAPAQSSTAR